MPIQPTDNKLSYVCILSRERRLAGGRRLEREKSCGDLLVCLVVLQAQSHQVALGDPKYMQAHKHTHKERTGYSWNINVQF